MYSLRRETNSKYSFSTTKQLTASATISSKTLKYDFNLKFVNPCKYKFLLSNRKL